MTNCKSWSMWIFLFLNSLFAGNYLKNLTIIIKKIKSYHCLFIEKKFYSMSIVFIVIRIKPLACRKKRVGDAIHMSYMLATTIPRYFQILMFSTASLLVWTGLWICSSARCETTLNKVKRSITLQDYKIYWTILGPKRGNKDLQSQERGWSQK